MDPIEKSLKSSFVGAANQLTQLYTSSLNYQKQAFYQGYNRSTRDTLEWAIKQSQNKSSISVTDLLEYLRTREPPLDATKRMTEEVHSLRGETNTRSTTSNPSEQFDMFSNSGSFSFAFGNPPNSPTMNANPPNPFGFMQSEPRTHSPTDSAFFASNPSNINHPSATLPPVNNQGYYVNNDNKKRMFDYPTSSMEYSFPDQLSKKNKVDT